jgi:hypothetical protein
MMGCFLRQNSKETKNTLIVNLLVPYNQGTSQLIGPMHKFIVELGVALKKDSRGCPSPVLMRRRVGVPFAATRD